MSNNEKVYLTVLTNEKYIPGLKALKKSLLKTKTKYNLVVLIPDDRKELVDILSSNKILDSMCSYLLKPNIKISYDDSFPYKNDYWMETFFKLVSAKCIEFKKIVLLDLDLLILKNIDDLFDKPNYSAVYTGRLNPSNCKQFNSGLFVFEPNTIFFNSVLKALERGKEYSLRVNYRIGDQDVFNFALLDWFKHHELSLDQSYNVFFYEMKEIMENCKYRKKDIKVVHFTGHNKPWAFKLFSKYNLKIIFSFIKHFKFFQLHLYLRYIRYSK